MSGDTNLVFYVYFEKDFRMFKQSLISLEFSKNITDLSIK